MQRKDHLVNGKERVWVRTSSGLDIIGLIQYTPSRVYLSHTWKNGVKAKFIGYTRKGFKKYEQIG